MPTNSVIAIKITLLKNKTLYGLLVIAMMFLSSCTKDDPQGLNSKTATLYHCTSKSFEPYICFDSLITDSRCPKGAECFWEGTALIKVSFHEKDKMYQFFMSLKGFPAVGHPSDTIIDHYRISFTDLKPYPEINVSQTDYQATFDISHE